MSKYNSKLALSFCFLLPMFMAGCGGVTPKRVNTILPGETFGFTLPQQSSTGSAALETPRPIPTLSPTATTSATPTPSWVAAADTSVDLRSCPSTTCDIVGQMSEGQKVLAVGMLSDGGWIQIEYPDSPTGTAWVYGELVHLSGDTPPIVAMLPSATPFLPAIAPRACTPSGPIKLLLGYLPEHPTQLIGGGYVQSGDFIFEIWLGCDSLFGSEAEFYNHYSDIPGLGLHLVLSYRGSTEKGEIVELWGVRGPGMQPVMEAGGSGTSGMVSSSISENLIGLRIPPESLPNLSQPGEHPLEFVYQASNPRGERTGAVLVFTLVNKPDGFYLMDINIKPLSAQELSAQKP